jgi:hypothetical protein
MISRDIFIVTSFIVDPTLGAQSYPGPCSYCTKTTKKCTFEWVMSQEPALKSRKESNASEQIKPPKRPKGEENPAQTNVASSQSSTSPSELLTNESEWSYGPAASITSTDSSTPELRSINTSSQVLLDYSELQNVALDNFGRQNLEPPLSHPLDPFPVPNSIIDSYHQLPSSSLYQSHNQIWYQNAVYGPSADISRLYPRPKRALMSSEQIEASENLNEDEPLANFKNIEFMFNLGPDSFPERLTKSADHEFIRQNLMQIYHDSMENALSCWLNERTCPYRISPKAITGSEDSTKQSLHQAWSDDWPNRIFARVNNLDRVSGRFRDRPLSTKESEAASKALYFVIMAFASQWAQSSRRSKEQHPSMFRNGQDGEFFNDTRNRPNDYYEFDRVLQETYWNKARKALLDCADVESFKVAFANIIFSLTQKPMSQEQQANIRNDSNTSSEQLETDFESLEDRVTKIIDEDGPPIYLEQGVRHAHSLRHKLQRREREIAKQRPGVDPTQTVLNEQDRTTVDMMAWLGYMLESLTSAMHQRPLVVADEDTDVLPQSLAALDISGNDDQQQPGNSPVSAISQDPTSASRLWDNYFFLQEQHNQRDNTQHQISHLSPYLSQAAFLTDAAPIKVLLYRKLTHLQSLLSRYAAPAKIESGIAAAINVYNHWISAYEPFIKDCIVHHDLLNPRIQSWYICLTGHFHLAALLFADLLESIDAGSGVGLESHAAIRKRTRLVAHLRQHNTRMVSDLARCATPRANASFPQQAGRWHFALNEGALLTEPWTALLIRVFSKAAVLLLAESTEEAKNVVVSKASSMSPENGSVSSTVADRRGSTGWYDVAEQLARRADDCIRALKYLGRKSDTARLAGDTLDEALRKRWGVLLKDNANNISAEAGPADVKIGNITGVDGGSINVAVLLDTTGQQQQPQQPPQGGWFDPVVLGAEDAWLGVGLEQELMPELVHFPGQAAQGISVPSGVGGEEKWEWL